MSPSWNKILTKPFVPVWRLSGEKSGEKREGNLGLGQEGFSRIGKKETTESAVALGPWKMTWHLPWPELTNQSHLVLLIRKVPLARVFPRLRKGRGLQVSEGPAPPLLPRVAFPQALLIWKEVVLEKILLRTTDNLTGGFKSPSQPHAINNNREERYACWTSIAAKSGEICGPSAGQVQGKDKLWPGSRQARFANRGGASPQKERPSWGG